MILMLSCSCGGADNLLRTQLKAAGRKDWLTAERIEGQGPAKQAVAELQQSYPELAAQFNPILAHLDSNHNFAIVIGYDPYSTPPEMRWVDIKFGGEKELIDSQIIAREF